MTKKNALILTNSAELSTSLKRYIFFVVDESLNIFAMSFENANKIPLPREFVRSEVLIIEPHNIISVHGREYIDNYGIRIFSCFKGPKKILLYNSSSEGISMQWDFCVKIPSCKIKITLSQLIKETLHKMDIKYNTLSGYFPTMYKIPTHHNKIG